MHTTCAHLLFMSGWDGPPSRQWNGDGIYFIVVVNICYAQLSASYSGEFHGAQILMKGTLK